MSTDLSQTELERPQTRVDLARQLLERVERLPELLNTVPLATEVQLLKRDLSRGHEVLRAFPEERSFLSVVTLVESVLACLTWKEYTPQIVDALRQAFTAGIHQAPFTFADYDAICRLFGQRGIRTVPSVNLAIVPKNRDG